jgi:ABC-type Fe3+/spermidine/putrescine transport system ATPase subunit
MTTVRIDRVSKRFGQTVAVDEVSLEIASGELFFLLGPSGCGKTTLLRLIAGFLEPDSGEIYFNGQPMRRVPVQKRNLGIVFQHYALWPHRSVLKISPTVCKSVASQHRKLNAGCKRCYASCAWRSAATDTHRNCREASNKESPWPVR